MPVARSASTANTADASERHGERGQVGGEMAVAGGQHQRRRVARHGEQPGVAERGRGRRSRPAR